MNEIITDLDARQLADRLTAMELHSTSELARLEQERNEAREKYATEATEHMLAVNKVCNERDEAREEWGKASMDAAQLLSEKTKVMAERDEAREALRDMLGWWRYIRKVHGDLYGVGCDRAQTKAEKVLEETK